MNALSLLRGQHREAERLFSRLDAETDAAAQRLLVETLVDHLAAHLAAAESVLYPVAYGARSQDLLTEALEDHRETLRRAAELVDCGPGHLLFHLKLHALRREFEAHVVEQEDLFDVLERRFGDALLEKLGADLAVAYARVVRAEVPTFTEAPEASPALG